MEANPKINIQINKNNLNNNNNNSNRMYNNKRYNQMQDNQNKMLDFIYFIIKNK